MENIHLILLSSLLGFLTACAALLPNPQGSLLLSVLQRLRYPGHNQQSGQAGGDSLSTEELRSVLHEAGNGLPDNRRNMLLGILDLEKMTVNDIMIPRNELVGIDLDQPVERIIRQLHGTTYTRLPVYRGDLNQVEGIVHMRQIARLLTHNSLSAETLKNICVPPYFVPESTPLTTQLINFQKEKRRIGIVVDEYGDVQGAVTLEDILEEIVGEFTSQPLISCAEISPQADGSVLIDGTASIRDVNRQLHWDLPSDGPKTLNGLVTEVLESIPECPVCLQIGDYRLEILQAAANRVKSLRAWDSTRNAQDSNDG